MNRTNAWIASLTAWLVAAQPAGAAEPVYECRDARGHVAFQDRPCAAAQRERIVEILPAPPPAQSPEYAVPRPASRQAITRAAPRRPAMSWACRTEDGTMFYRHARCPATIRDRIGGTARSVRVTGTEIPRKEACRRMRAPHAGSEHDDRVSTYDRNLGRDPCRRS